MLYCIRYLVPDDANSPYEMSAIIKKIVDDNTLFEIMPNFAKNIICGFARMDGRTVGVSCSCSCICIVFSPVDLHSILLSLVLVVFDSGARD